MIEIKIWGNSDGLQTFYTSKMGELQNNWPTRILSWDPYTQIPWEANGIHFYSITKNIDCLIFTSFFTVNDYFGRPRGILASSLMMRQSSKIQDCNIFDILLELSGESKSRCLNEENKIDTRSTEWKYFDNLLKRKQVFENASSRLSYIDENASSKAFIVYKTEADLKEFINNPFRQEYKAFKEIYFIPSLDLYNGFLKETNQLEKVLKEGDLFAKKNLTDLTSIVPPREKSYKVHLTPKPTPVGATLPNLESHDIDFRVNHQRVVDIGNAEVYKGDEIFIEVNHPKCEQLKKTIRVGDDYISGDKVSIPIHLTFRPNTVMISIINEQNQQVVEGVEITMKDKSGNSNKLKPNLAGLYEVEVSFGESLYYDVVATEYKVINGKGRIDFDTKDVTVNIKHNVKSDFAIIGNGGFKKHSKKGKHKVGDKVVFPISKSKWDIVLDKLRIGSKALISLFAISILIVFSFIIYKILIKDTEEIFNPNNSLYREMETDSINISRMTVSEDMDLLIGCLDDYNSLGVKISSQDVDSLKRIHKNVSSMLRKKLQEISSKGEVKPVEPAPSNTDTERSEPTDEISAEDSHKSAEKKTEKLKQNEMNKFNSIYTLKELTKGNDGVKRLEELNSFLNKPNLDQKQKEEYGKRYIALNNIYKIIENCRSKCNDHIQINSCLANISVYSENLTKAQRDDYLGDENEWKEFVNLICK